MRIIFFNHKKGSNFLRQVVACDTQFSLRGRRSKGKGKIIWAWDRASCAPGIESLSPFFSNVFHAGYTHLDVHNTEKHNFSQYYKIHCDQLNHIEPILSIWVQLTI